MAISFNKDEKVNICGISENEFDPDGWCRKCKNTCEMIPQVMIDKKIYVYAKRNGIIKGNILGTYTSMFSNSEFVNYFRDEKKYKRAPKYVKMYLRALEEEFSWKKGRKMNERTVKQMYETFQWLMKEGCEDCKVYMYAPYMGAEHRDNYDVMVNNVNKDEFDKNGDRIVVIEGR